MNTRRRRRRFALAVEHRVAFKPSPLVQPPERRLQRVRGVADSAGFRFRFSVNVGAHMGNEVAQEVVDTQLRRR